MKSSIPPQSRVPHGGHARSSRRRYAAFVHDYKGGHLDDDDNSPDTPAQTASEKKDGAADKKARRRKYVREYGHWLWPHRYEVGALFALALVVAGLELIEPLFMRYIVDHILLKKDMATAERLHHLHF